MKSVIDTRQYPDPHHHIVHARQFDDAYLTELFALTDKIKKTPETFQNTLRGKVVATLFYEPSTRTRFSFESAVARLGGAVITTENGQEFSSAAKGETLEDSIRVVSSYADIIIMRHFDDDSSERAVSHMKESAIIMHPLPRIDEIAPSVDTDKRAQYFLQAENGLWVRMALLTMLFRGKYNHMI